MVGREGWRTHGAVEEAQRLPAEEVNYVAYLFDDANGEGSTHNIATPSSLGVTLIARSRAEEGPVHSHHHIHSVGLHYILYDINNAAARTQHSSAAKVLQEEGPR